MSDLPHKLHHSKLYNFYVKLVLQARPPESDLPESESCSAAIERRRNAREKLIKIAQRMSVDMPAKDRIPEYILRVLNGNIRNSPHDWNQTSWMALFEILEEYAWNLLHFPWKKEYRTIVMYSGFYKSRIEKVLPLQAERLFAVLGYVHEPESQKLSLCKLPSQTNVMKVAFDFFKVHLEMRIQSRIVNSSASRSVVNDRTLCIRVYEARKSNDFSLDSSVDDIQQQMTRTVINKEESSTTRLAGDCNNDQQTYRSVIGKNKPTTHQGKTEGVIEAPGQRMPGKMNQAVVGDKMKSESLVPNYSDSARSKAAYSDERLPQGGRQAIKILQDWPGEDENSLSMRANDKVPLDLCADDETGTDGSEAVLQISELDEHYKGNWRAHPDGQSLKNITENYHMERKDRMGAGLSRKIPVTGHHDVDIDGSEFDNKILPEIGPSKSEIDTMKTQLSTQSWDAGSRHAALGAGLNSPPSLQQHTSSIRSSISHKDSEPYQRAALLSGQSKKPEAQSMLRIQPFDAAGQPVSRTETTHYNVVKPRTAPITPSMRTQGFDEIVGLVKRSSNTEPLSSSKEDFCYSRSHDDRGCWQCPQCTFVNQQKATLCDMCYCIKP